VRRKRLQHLRLVLGLQRLQNRNGVVALQVADAFGHGFDRKLVKNVLTGGLADFGERRKVKIRAHQGDQFRTGLVIQQLKQRAEIRFMQCADEFMSFGGILLRDGAFDARHEIGTRFAALVAENIRLGRRFFTIERHTGTRFAYIVGA